ncbi:MAG: thymidine phosphorylase, partial [Pseudomonadota bacterium]|nr:thymidine phosphorylase [Pseudomonadota bacterium]
MRATSVRSQAPILAQEVIRAQRDHGTLSAAQIQAFVDGLTASGAAGWSEGQIAALAMAVLLRGLDPGATTTLTQAMTRSGTVLDWSQAALPGPVLDKHSTGGVGDKVSLLLAPIVAACGGFVPMISGRGLGHTGGTLDKLEALPGYRTEVPHDTLLTTLRTAGCAIVGASAELAPADRRLYAVRDSTATVESVPLITASILSKKLAAGLQALVLDVKLGSGAFTPTLEAARTLARSLVQVARGAGLTARALITDMNQVLGHSAGNALEVREAIDYLKGVEREPRLHEVTMALAAELLQLGGLAATVDKGRRQAARVLASGAAAEHFARMVAALGGPADVLTDARLPVAAVKVDVPALAAGMVEAVDVRALGLAVVRLGGGRTRPGAAIDPGVGLTHVAVPGQRVQGGQAIAVVHAATVADAEQAIHAVQRALRVSAASLCQAPGKGSVVWE